MIGEVQLARVFVEERGNICPGSVCESSICVPSRIVEAVRVVVVGQPRMLGRGHITVALSLHIVCRVSDEIRSMCPAMCSLLLY
jgi:hypothetical protein